MSRRCGIRIRGHRGNPIVRKAYIRFARWLRDQYEFPIRVPVYLHPSEQIRTINGDLGVASFFAPWDRGVEPYIRVATGDFQKLRGELGRDNALASCIVSLSHEVVHYQQWVETGEIYERGVAQKARKILRRYARAVDRP